MALRKLAEKEKYKYLVQDKVIQENNLRPLFKRSMSIYEGSINQIKDYLKEDLLEKFKPED